MTPEEVVERINSEIGEIIEETKQPNSRRVYHTVDKQYIKELATLFHQDLRGRLATITGRDTETGIQLLYHFVFDHDNFYCTLRVILDREEPVVESIHEIIPGAAAVEREIKDFLGVKVKNVKSAEDFLKFEGLPDDYYPLRQGVEGPPDE